MIEISLKTTVGAARLERLRKALGDDVILNTLELRFLAWVDQNFRDAGTESRWAPLRPGTVMLQAGPTGKSRQRTKPLESWRQKVHSRITGNTLWVGFAEEIQKLAAIHHFGTGPFVIRAKNKKVLAAAIPGGMQFSPIGGNISGGYMFFGKEVHHPGIPKRPLIPSSVLAHRLAKETLEEMLKRVVESNDDVSN